MQKPYNRHFNAEQGTSLLYFKDAERGEYYVRGGICFPMFVDGTPPDVFGYAVLGCQDINTGVVSIFEHQPYHVIDNIVENGEILHQGLASWFNLCWSRYYGRKFFYSQDYETSRKYRLDIHRSGMIQPKPEIIEIESYDEADRQHIVWSYVKMNRLRFEANSTIHIKLENMKRGDKTPHPAIYALQVLLCGIDRFPYRKKETA